MTTEGEIEGEHVGKQREPGTTEKAAKKSGRTGTQMANRTMALNRGEYRGRAKLLTA